MNKKELESLLIAKEVEITELKAKHADGIKSLQQNKEYYSSEMTRAKNELEQIDCMLDSVPNSIPREIKYGAESWEIRRLSTLTRLAAWFASF